MTTVSVFEAIVRDGYEWVMPEREEDLDPLMQLRGDRVGSLWKPIRMKLIREDQGQYRRTDLSQDSDFPWFGSGVLIVRRRARDALLDLLDSHGELLALTCDDAELWLFNATTVVDGLDEARSDVVRFSTGAMHIRQPAFHARLVRGLAAFKGPQSSHGPIFFGEEFVERVNSSQLTGLEFERVWATDDNT